MIIVGTLIYNRLIFERFFPEKNPEKTEFKEINEEETG